MKSIALRLLFLELVCFAFTYLAFGYYYGWIDDVFKDIIYKTIFAVEATNTGTDFTGYGNLLVKLYAWKPMVPWYGILIYGLVFLACYNIFYLLFHTMRKAGLKNIWIYPLLALFYYVFLTENIYLINYTRVTTLMIIPAFILLEVEIRKDTTNWWLVIHAVLCIVLGNLIRTEVGLMASAFGMILLVLFSGSMFASKSWKRPALLVGMALLIAAEFFFIFGLFTNDQQNHAYYNTELIGFVDGMNDNGVPIAPEDQANMNALKAWFFFDEDVFTREYVTYLKDKYLQTNTEILRQWRKKLGEEVSKSRNFFSKNYHFHLNWWLKSIVMLILIWFLGLADTIMPSVKRKRLRIRSLLLFNLLATLLLLGTTVFFKMEDRVLYPLLLSVLLANIVFTKWAAFPGRKKLLFVIVAASVIAGIWRTNEYSTVSREKEKELDMKESIRKELASLDADFYFTGMWSMTLFHHLPFKGFQIENKEKYQIYGEYWTLLFTRQRELLSELCDSYKVDKFFPCLANRYPGTIFIYTDFRKDILEAYLRETYHLPLHFEKVSTPDMMIEQIEYSFIWAPLNFGYYKLVADPTDDLSNQIPSAPTGVDQKNK